jgi:hypothetical protein
VIPNIVNIPMIQVGLSTIEVSALQSNKQGASVGYTDNDTLKHDREWTVIAKILQAGGP